MQLSTPSALFLLATCAYLGIRGYYKRRQAGSTPATSRSSPGDWVLVALVTAGQIVLPLLFVFTPVLDWATHGNLPQPLPWLGALLMAAGLWLFWRSHADLGDNWSVTLEVHHQHQLVSSGVYQRLRHPMYASFFLMAAGQWLLLPNGVAGPGALVAVLGLYRVRKPNEEAMLLEAFGDEYRRYMASTGGVVPRWRSG